jgi:hypothetical protein
MRQRILFDDLTRCYFEVNQYGRSDIMYTDTFARFVRRVRFVVGSIDDNVVPPKYGALMLPMDSNDWIQYVSVAALHLDTHKYLDRNNIQMIENVRQRSIPCSPVMVEMLKELILKLSFNPANVKKNKVKGIVSFAKSGAYSDKGVSAEVISVLAVVDGRFPQYTFPVMSGYIYDYEHGLANRYMAGNSYVGYLATLNKMGANIVEPKLPNAMKSLCYVADSLIYRAGFNDCEYRKLDFSERTIYQVLKSLDSSTGWYNDRIFRFTRSGVKEILKCKKKHLAGEVYGLIRRLIDHSEQYVSGQRTDEPLWNMFAQECRKWEFRTMNMMSRKMSAEVASECLLKERLFYIDNIVAYIFGREIFKDLAFLFCGYQSMIGIKVEAGGLHQLWDLLAGNFSSPLYDDWQAAYVVAESYGVDLSRRIYVKGDFKKFDQTLLGQVLAVVAGLAIPFISKPDDMSDACFEYILTVMVTEVVYKTMYIYSTSSLYDVWGSMFSGKYVTSAGDTDYQMLIRPIHLMLVYLKYAHIDPVVKLVLHSQMIVNGFYGDDNVESYPAYLDNFCYYDDSPNFAIDYVRFCEREFGLVSKEEEFQIYEDCYATHCFVTVGEAIVLDAYREGLVFIRNTISHVYLDGEYLGDYPYRDTEDIMAKVGRVLTASKSMGLTMCLIASLARLSSGNLEAFSQLEHVYQELLRVNGPVTYEDWKVFKKSKTSNSLARMIGQLGEFKDGDLFPNLFQLHETQRKGHVERTGLCPTKDGALFSYDELYYNRGKSVKTLWDGELGVGDRGPIRLHL